MIGDRAIERSAMIGDRAIGDPFAVHTIADHQMVSWLELEGDADGSAPELEAAQADIEIVIAFLIILE